MKGKELLIKRNGKTTRAQFWVYPKNEEERKIQEVSLALDGWEKSVITHSAVIIKEEK